MAQQQFHVDGLHSQGCAQALMTLPAVTSVNVDLDMKGTSTVQVDTGPPLSSADVQAALDAHGNFPVVS